MSKNIMYWCFGIILVLVIVAIVYFLTKKKQAPVIKYSFKNNAAAVAANPAAANPAAYSTNYYADTLDATVDYTGGNGDSSYFNDSPATEYYASKKFY